MYVLALCTALFISMGTLMYSAATLTIFPYVYILPFEFLLLFSAAKRFITPQEGGLIPTQLIRHNPNIKTHIAITTVMAFIFVGVFLTQWLFDTKSDPNNLFLSTFIFMGPMLIVEVLSMKMKRGERRKAVAALEELIQEQIKKQAYK